MDSGYTAEFAAQLATTTFESSLQSIKISTTEKEVQVDTHTCTYIHTLCYTFTCMYMCIYDSTHTLYM